MGPTATGGQPPKAPVKAGSTVARPVGAGGAAGRHGDDRPAGVDARCDMTYVTLHWTAGAYVASAADKEHYHIIVESDGKLVRGDKPISANVSTADDNYAAHTASANTKNIGIACGCMAGAGRARSMLGSTR